MNLYNKTKIKGKSIIPIAIVVFTIIATIIKPFFGIDYDETYIVALGARLIQGDHMFKEMWEIHQTSAIPVTIIMLIHQNIFGRSGLFLGLRIVSSLVQVAIAVLTYLVFSRKRDKSIALFIASIILSFLPRGTQNFEYGLLSVNFFWISILLLYYIQDNYEIDKKRATFVYCISGVCFSLGVLSYPTMAIVVLFVIPYFIRYDKRGLIYFLSVCILCAVFFLLFVLTNITLSEFLINLQCVFLDGSHGDTGLLGAIIRLVPDSDKLKQGILVIIVSVIFYLVYWMVTKERIHLVYWIMASSSLILVLLNITGIRPSGVFGFNIRYILVLIFGVVLVINERRRKDNLGIDAGDFLFLVTGVGILVGSLLGSNLSIVENIGFASIAIIEIVILALKNGEIRDNSIKYICVVLFIISIVFVKGFTVRIEGTMPANILEHRDIVKDGVLKGIWLDPKEVELLEKQEDEIINNISASDVPLYISNNPVFNIISDNYFTSANCISTPVYDKQWIEYYNNRDYVFPTRIVLDKNWIEPNSFFEETEFGRYLKDIVDMDEVVETENFVFYYVGR